jgi:uracil phosphoribosyltransferase
MSKVICMEHPLIQHKIGIMRRKSTSTKEFRDLVSEVAMLICYEATRELPLADIEIETPLVKTIAQEIAGKKLCIVPILRAGLHMADGILNLIPNAKVGHIGLYRNEETLEPVEYFCKLPIDAAEREIFVVDPMLATGGSASAAIQLLKNKGITKIHFLCLIAAPEGVKRFTDEHPDVDVYIGALDERLDENGYILPGLGDAGDRIYGTK